MRRHIPTIFSPALSQDNNVPRPVPLLSSSSSSSVPCSPSGIPAWSLHAAVTAITTQIKSNPRLQHSCTTSLAGPPSIPASQYTDKQENSLQASRSKGSKQRGLVNKWIGFAIKMVSSNRCKVFRTSVWDFCLLKILKNFCLVSCKRCSSVGGGRPVATEILFRVFDVTAAGTHQLDCSDILLGNGMNFSQFYSEL